MVIDKLYGMTVYEAAKYVSEWGYIIRVVKNNGIPQICTLDYNTKRINVEIRDVPDALKVITRVDSIR